MICDQYENHLPVSPTSLLGGVRHNYNHQRYHDSLGNMTLADMYHGRAPQIQSKRARVKEKTISERRRLNRQPAANLLL